MRVFNLLIMLLLGLCLNAQSSLQFTKETNSNFQFNDVKDADFKLFSESDYSIKNGSYWFKIIVSSPSESVLHIPSPHVHNFKLYSASGKEIEEISYTRYPSFALDEFEEYPLYLNVVFEKEAYFPVQIISMESFVKATQRDLFKMGTYFGFALMVIIINFMCFFLFDEKVFLYYCAVLTTITLSFFYSDGLFRLFGLNNGFVTTFLEPLLHLSVVLFAAYFATKFLKLDECLPKIKYITIGLISLAATSFTLYWITENWIFSAIANTLVWSVLLNYLIAGAMLFQKKMYARFYVGAYSILFILILDYYVLAGFGWSVLNVSAFQLKIGGAIEMLVLTYAIMYRMRVIKEENQLMQLEMRLYLKRIELLRGTDSYQMTDDLYLENLINEHELDNQETKVLQYISRGKDNLKIASKLKISVSEVDRITKSLYDKLDINDQVIEDHKMVDEQPDYIYN